MKEKKPFVIFRVPIEGKYEDAKVYTEDLRKLLNNAKLNKDVTEVEIGLEYLGKNYKIPIKISDVKKLIKQSELCIPIVPNFLSEYLVDLTQSLANKPTFPVKGRENEIEKIWFYLSQKSRNNVFLVGPADVGKTTIAREIARQISTNECPKEFYDKRVLMLKPERLLKIKSEYFYMYTIKKINSFIVKNKDKFVIYIDKSIYMKTDQLLIILLYSLIKKYNIPIITTSNEEDFEQYYLNDTSISKYVNYIYIEEPELEEIAPMVNQHILRLQKEHGIKISDEMIKFGIFTSVLTDSVSANPGNVINTFEKAFLEAKRKDKEEVDKKSILSCYNSYLKLYNNTSEEEKKAIAYHETGHYVVSIMCNHVKNEKIAFVSILPMMDFLGVNWSYTILGKTLNYTKDYFFDYIAICLGGRISEKMFTSKDSTGASSDLAKASSIAENMITIYGLSEKEGEKNRSYVSDNFAIKNYLISEKRKEEFDSEIQRFVDEGYKRAEKIIEENRGLIDVIVEKLLKEEILTGEQLTKICEEYNKNK